MKRNTLTTAVLAGLTGVAGMAGVANAVNVNPDGLGQVLLYPYYSARGGNDTLISIVNTTDRGKAVKIRFIEALNSREVLDFNIYLSEFDVWVAAVTATEDGGGKMITTDTTCTVRYFVGEADDGVGEQEFLDFQYAAAPFPGFDGTADGGPQGIERTASGYIEVIEMGTILEDHEVNTALEHDATGVPPGCDFLVDLWAEPAGGVVPGEGEPGYWNVNPNWGFDTEQGASGGLFGSASIINGAEGTLFSYNATAIDGFWTAGTTFHTNPGLLTPSLASGNEDTSNVFINGALVTQTWDPGPFAVNATLTLAQLMNEYAIEAGLGASTEWVLTFPTKRFHADDAVGGPNPGALGDVAIPPFTQTWTDESNEACEVLEYRFWDREEQEPTEETPPPEGPPISPTPPPQPDPEVPVFQLCREANVMRFAEDGGAPPAETEIFKEPLRSGDFAHLSYTNFNLPVGWDSGWVRFDFSSRESIPDSENNVNVGLPVVGFSAQRFVNSTLEVDGATVLSNYGGTFNHRGSRQFPQSAEIAD